MAIAIASFLLFAGDLLFLVGLIWLIVKAFQEHIVWGTFCLIFPPLVLVFAFLDLEMRKKPVIVLCSGLVLAGLGWILR
ncbi:MAG: hypothetical protein ACYTHM_00575 [Planctomycetota bacterium]|jgi:hypothetical protein